MDDIAQENQHQLNQQKNLIFARLDAKERSLIAKVNRNPKIWKSDSLDFKLERKIQNFWSAVSFDVTLTAITGPLSINVNVVSGRPNYKSNERILCGSYSFVETVNDRPVYKVRFLLQYKVDISACQ